MSLHIDNFSCKSPSSCCFMTTGTIKETHPNQGKFATSRCALRKRRNCSCYRMISLSTPSWLGGTFIPCHNVYVGSQIFVKCDSTCWRVSWGSPWGAYWHACWSQSMIYFAVLFTRFMGSFRRLHRLVTLDCRSCRSTRGHWHGSHCWRLCEFSSNALY
jgi:hypothetical protein